MTVYNCLVNENKIASTLLEVSRHICRPRLKGIPTYMSPKVKGYTDVIYVIITYMGTETRVIWVIYSRNPLFRASFKIFFTSKRVKMCNIFI